MEHYLICSVRLLALKLKIGLFMKFVCIVAKLAALEVQTLKIRKSGEIQCLFCNIVVSSFFVTKIFHLPHCII